MFPLASGPRLVLEQNGGRALRTAGLTIDAASKLDLKDNDLIIDYAGVSPLGQRIGSAYAGVAGMIQRGRTENGTWDGAGITTSMPAAATELTGLGVGEMRDLLGLPEGETAMWKVETVDATTIIVKYTYAGDANLDGVIDGGDYGVIDNFVQMPNAFGDFNGDFNCDGVIDGGDLRHHRRQHPGTGATIVIGTGAV